VTSTETRRANPFPGLRPFEEDEDDLFFGRDDQIDDLVGRLRRRRFIAVIGTSGSGKSSLVRAGLLPALHGGFMSGAGSRWRVVTMRPGSSPIANLALALDAAGLAGAPDTAAETRVGLTRAGLDRGSRGLVDVLRDADLGKHDNVLIVVDQFEELFRFQQDNPNEAAAFVKLLSTASDSPDVLVYVLLTMRSDFLGDCAQFGELAQRINDGLFLVPRMTWDQLRDAIEMPVRAAGADIQAALVTRLLNDLGDNPDQLPVLQHALMRTWDMRPESGAPFVLTLDDLARTGGLGNALSRHGDAVLATLDERDRVATEKFFKCITELGNDNRGIRRPTRLGKICAITGVPFEDMCRVVEAFRAPECSFLAVRAGPLTENTVIDIAHEGLMRLWNPLTEWVEEEARSARQYRRLSTAATLHAENNAALWRNPDLQIAESWRAREEPNAAWGTHVDPRLDFGEAIAFLDASVAERAHERTVRLRRTRLIIGALGVLVVILSGITFIAVQQAHLAATERVNTVVAQSHFLARDANAAIDKGDAVTGMLLALEALKIGGDDTPREAEFALQSALTNQHERFDLTGHSDVVEGVAFSPDGRRIVSGGGLLTIVWDAATGTQRLVLRGHTGGGLSWVSFSPDGREILTSGDHTARLWNAATGAPGAVYSEPGNVQAESAVYSPAGDRIVVASDDHVARVFDAELRRAIAVLRGHTREVTYAAFSPDGKRVVTTSRDKTARVWDAATGKPLLELRGHTSDVQSAAFSPDGRRITTGSLDDTIRNWDATTGAPLATIFVDAGGVTSVAYSRDGRYLVNTGNDGTLRVWLAGGMHLIEILAGHDGTANVAAFSPDGKRLVSGSIDRTVRVWDVASRAHERVLRQFGGPVVTPSFSPDGKRVVTGSFDGSLRVWDATSGALMMKLRGDRGHLIVGAFSPDGRRVVTAGHGTVQVWNATNGTLLATFRGPSIADWITYSPDAHILAVADRAGPVRLLDARNGASIRVIPGTSAVWTARFSRDGKRLVTSSEDDTARIFKVATGVQIRAFRQHEGPVYSAAFSPDGTRVVSSSLDHTLRIWDAASGRQLLILYGHQGPVNAANFSRDGRRIASGSFDRSVRIWDAQTGAQIAVFQGHEGGIYGTAFSPDGRHVVSSSVDETARIWNIPAQQSRDELINEATAAAPRQLTKSQRAQEFLP
jgi:WD40 repeat protein